ncbi:type II toxin-antitoxin system VapC family toxin [Luteococcus sp. H138]|uniref:type II toxin-antitoxin system VapC family toxin n=1 Tax=unclassified Luteococcus TaxID=2639923 RepID=UPI00313DE9B0
MIIDTSALIAVLRGEPERRHFLELMDRAERLWIGAPTLVELGMVVDGIHDPVVTRALDTLLDQLGVEVLPFDAAQARVAREAFRDFGKGSGHPAQLNFGDCLTYAAAKASGEPLLYKGNDFPHTDLRTVND